MGIKKTSLILGGGTLVGAACAEAVFEFDSGGANHPSGYGGWLVTVNTYGNFAVAHDVRGQTLILVTNVTAVRQWKEELLDKTTLAADDDGATRKVEVWKNDVLQDKRVARALVDRLAALITEYAGAKPILK